MKRLAIIGLAAAVLTTGASAGDMMVFDAGNLTTWNAYYAVPLFTAADVQTGSLVEPVQIVEYQRDSYTPVLWQDTAIDYSGGVAAWNADISPMQSGWLPKAFSNVTDFSQPQFLKAELEPETQMLLGQAMLKLKLQDTGKLAPMLDLKQLGSGGTVPGALIFDPKKFSK